jgi:hypothetical protein
MLTHRSRYHQRSLFIFSVITTRHSSPVIFPLPTLALVATLSLHYALPQVMGEPRVERTSKGEVSESVNSSTYKSFTWMAFQTSQ